MFFSKTLNKHLNTCLNTVSYMVCDEGFHSLIRADQGYKAQSALLPSFVDNRVAANSKLIVHNVVLHLQ